MLPQITFPAALVAGFIAATLLAIIWCCTRPRAAAFLSIVIILGILSLASGDILRIAIWMLIAPIATHYYFVIIPDGPSGGPSWCEVRARRLCGPAGRAIFPLACARCCSPVCTLSAGRRTQCVPSRRRARHNITTP
jgi:hypothetical protein